MNFISSFHMGSFLTLLFIIPSIICIYRCNSNEQCEEEYPFCWTDGKCRSIKQVIMSIKKVEAKKSPTHSFKLIQDERICITGILNPMAFTLPEFSGGKDFSTLISEYTNLPLKMFIYDLRICSSDFNDRMFPSHDTNNGSYIPKTYIKSYDPSKHFSTGCFSNEAKGFYQYSFISHKDKKGKHLRKIQLSDKVYGIVDDRDKISFSSENVATSSCFNVKPVGPEESPVLIQASIVISLDPSFNNSHVKHNDNFTLTYLNSFGNFNSFQPREMDTYQKNHEYLHECLTSYQPKGILNILKNNEDNGGKDTVEQKNQRLKHRHRKMRFKIQDDNKEPHSPYSKEKETYENQCNIDFNMMDTNSKIITITSEDIVPSSVIDNKNVNNEKNFNYEAMQTQNENQQPNNYQQSGEENDQGILGKLKHYYHYYYYDDDNEYYYYYYHPYYHPHIHCKWDLKFRSGAGICESPNIIHEDSFHVFVIILSTIGIAIGIVFFIIDWKSRALFHL